MELETGDDDANRRLDRILRKALPEYPLSLIHRLFRQGQVLVDGRAAAPGDRVRARAIITVPGVSPVPDSRRRFSRSPQTGIDVLWRGAGLLILNKPPGLAVHGTGGMDALVRAYLADSLPPSLSFRPGPLHRLDKPSSGLIVFSASLEGARFFSALLREGRVRKLYLALAEGRVAEDELWEDELVRDHDARKTLAAQKGKTRTALTLARPLAITPPGRPAYTLLLAEIRTGRTHQIRAQAAAHGHPLAGDLKYGGHAWDDGAGRRRGGDFFLHAWNISLRETQEGSFPPAPLPRSITAPVPRAFAERADALFGEEFARSITAAGMYLFNGPPYNQGNVP